MTNEQQKEMIVTNAEKDIKAPTAVVQYLMTALATAGLLGIVYAVRGFYPLGNGSVVITDLYSQYAPLLYRFFDVVTAGKNLFMDFSMAGGVNLYADSINEVLNPFNYILLLFGRSRLYLGLNVLLFAYVVSAAVSANIMLVHLFDKQNRISGNTAFLNILLSVCYAMSGYMAYNYQIIKWMLFPVLFPLFILSLVRLLRKEKAGWYIALISWQLILSVQLGFMALLFTLMASGVYFACSKNGRKNNNGNADNDSTAKGRKLQLLFFGTVAGVLISCVVLVPEIKVLFSSARSGMNNSYLDIMKSHGLSDLFERMFQIANPVLIGLWLWFTVQICLLRRRLRLCGKESRLPRQSELAQWTESAHQSELAQQSESTHQSELAQHSESVHQSEFLQQSESTQRTKFLQRFMFRRKSESTEPPKQGRVISALMALLLLTVLFQPANLIWHMGSYMCFPVRYAYMVLLVGMCLIRQKHDELYYLRSYSGNHSESDPASSSEKISGSISRISSESNSGSISRISLESISGSISRISSESNSGSISQISSESNSGSFPGTDSENHLWLKPLAAAASILFSAAALYLTIHWQTGIVQGFSSLAISRSCPREVAEVCLIFVLLVIATLLALVDAPSESAPSICIFITTAAAAVCVWLMIFLPTDFEIRKMNETAYEQMTTAFESTHPDGINAQSNMLSTGDVNWTEQVGISTEADAGSTEADAGSTEADADSTEAAGNDARAVVSDTETSGLYTGTIVYPRNESLITGIYSTSAYFPTLSRTTQDFFSGLGYMTEWCYVGQDGETPASAWLLHRVLLLDGQKDEHQLKQQPESPEQEALQLPAKHEEQKPDQLAEAHEEQESEQLSESFTFAQFADAFNANKLQSIGIADCTEYADLDEHAGTLTVSLHGIPGGKMLMVPLVALEGWRCHIDGKAADCGESFGGLLSVQVPAGDSTIVFRFVPPGIMTGIILTILGVIMLIVIQYCTMRQRKQYYAIRQTKQYFTMRVLFRAALLIAALVIYIIPAAGLAVYTIRSLTSGMQGIQGMQNAAAGANPQEEGERILDISADEDGILIRMGTENLVRQKGVKLSADSVESKTLSPTNVADGMIDDHSSRWSSENNREDADHWLEVRFPKQQQVGMIRIYWERCNACVYAVEGSDDGKNWTTLAAFNEPSQERQQDVWLSEPFTARYVRLHVTDVLRNEEDLTIYYQNVSVMELEIYEGAARTLLVPEPTIPEGTGRDLPIPEVICLDDKLGKDDSAAESASADEADNNLPAQDCKLSFVGADYEMLVDNDGHIADTIADVEAEIGYALQIGARSVELPGMKVLIPASRKLFDDMQNLTKYSLNAEEDGRNSEEGSQNLEEDSRNSEEGSQNLEEDSQNMEGVNQIRSGDRQNLEEDSRNSEEDEQNLQENKWPHIPAEWAPAGDFVNMSQPLSIVISEAQDVALQAYAELLADELEQKTGARPEVVKVPLRPEEICSPGYAEKIYDFGHAEKMNTSIPASSIILCLSDKITMNTADSTFTAGVSGKEGYNILIDKQASSAVMQVEEQNKTAGQQEEGAENNEVTGQQEVEENNEVSRRQEVAEQNKAAEQVAAGIAVICANSTQGLRWGCVMMEALIAGDKTSEEKYLPTGLMRDYPRYSVRGIGIDVGRRPIGLEFLYELVPKMSYMRMNELQIHLNDNEIITSSGYDGTMEGARKLYSGFRLESLLKNKEGEGITSTDLYYTKEEFRKFIEDARVYGVNVIPEIDTPAHSLSLTKIFPEAGFANNPDGADQLDLSRPAATQLGKDIWREYLGDDGIFNDCIKVHAGMDEYFGKGEDYINYLNEITTFIQERQNSVAADRMADEENLPQEDIGCSAGIRVWASLSYIKANHDNISKNLEMQLWDTLWADPQETYDEGFSIVNSLSGSLYILPGGGYDHLDLQFLEKEWQPNTFTTQDRTWTLPAYSPRMLGACCMLWNDMNHGGLQIDNVGTPISEDGLMERLVEPMPVLSVKLW